MRSPAALPAAWRDRAEGLAPYAAPAAEAFRAAAHELEQALRARANEALTLAQAAEESGYSKRRLRELIADGTIAQAGRKYAPRIRRGDLPIRPGAPKLANGGYNLAEDAEDLVGRL